ncbi:MAG: hypothetical protein BroJett039_06700 [Chloroflexota bacterium]|nr:MAG: hypothetical protein BroJett039_06700 [Chloroflexota bacterium]
MEQSLITCPRCGTRARSGSRFCPSCGAPLEVRPPPSPLPSNASTRPLPKLLGAYQVRGVWENDAVIRLLTRSDTKAEYLALPLLEPLPEARVRELVSLTSTDDVESRNLFARVVEQIQAKRKTFLIVTAPRGQRLNSLTIPISGDRALEFFFQIQEILHHLQSAGLVTALPPPPIEGKFWKTLPFAQLVDKMSDEVYVRFQSESLERFRRCFALHENQMQLVDYTGWEPMPREPKERLARIQRDQILAARTMHWLYAGTSLGRRFNQIKASGGEANQIIMEAFSNLTGSPEQTGELVFRKTQKLHDQQRLGTQTRPLNSLPSGPPTKKLFMKLSADGLTDKGDTRDHNEDAILLFRVGETAGLFIVADGLGGHADGKLASDIVVKNMEESARAEWQPAQNADGATAQAILRKWIQLANQRVLDTGYARGSNMGSAITAALILNDTAYIANVGDSRTYLVRNKELIPITRDHSLVASLVAANLLSEEEIYTHPQRNQIFRSLGADAKVEIDVFEQPLAPHDMLILCSDGLWEMICKPQLEMLVNESNDPAHLCKMLVALANRNGGEDNISVIVIRADLG